MSNSLFSEPPSDTLANVAPGGAPPKRRINSVEAARSVYDDCLLDAEPAARVRASTRIPTTATKVFSLRTAFSASKVSRKCRVARISNSEGCTGTITP